MTIIFIILGIFIYLTIGSIFTKLFNHFKIIDDFDYKALFGLFVFFFPIMLIYVSSTALGKKISKFICNKHRKYTYNKQQRNSKRNMKKALNL